MNDWENYKVIRNEYSHMLKRHKNDFIQKEINSNIKNTKKLWKILKLLLKPGLNKNKSIMFETEEIVNDHLIADKFNKYFITSIKNINESIETVSMNLADPFEGQTYKPNLNKLETINITKLRKIVNKLENTSGIDEINAQILKDSFEIIGEDLLKIINYSLTTGIIPKSWKQSMIIPIPKVPNTTNGTEFRPINMLPIYEKVLELVVKEQLVQYLEYNKIFVNEQSGFRESHSCETALNLLLSKWKRSIERKNSIIAIFLDLKRAFETISRDELLIVLKKIWYM